MPGGKGFAFRLCGGAVVIGILGKGIGLALSGRSIRRGTVPYYPCDNTVIKSIWDRGAAVKRDVGRVSIYVFVCPSHLGGGRTVEAPGRWVSSGRCAQRMAASEGRRRLSGMGKRFRTHHGGGHGSTGRKGFAEHLALVLWKAGRYNKRTKHFEQRGGGGA